MVYVLRHTASNRLADDKGRERRLHLVLHAHGRRTWRWCAASGHDDDLVPRRFLVDGKRGPSRTDTEFLGVQKFGVCAPFSLKFHRRTCSLDQNILLLAATF